MITATKAFPRRRLLAAAGLAGLTAGALGGTRAVAQPSGPDEEAWARRQVPPARPSAELIRFPDDAFAKDPMQAGVLDVKSLFGAVGDGVTDDSDAIIAAIDAVQKGIYESIPTAEEGPPYHPGVLETQKIIYFPKGTYLVSRTLVYEFIEFFRRTPTTELEGHTCLRFRGESQTESIIKLADESPDFQDVDHPRPLLCWGRTPLEAETADEMHNNTVASNFLENLTIDTGSRNPGVQAVVFTGSNNGAVRNVSIRSGDGAGVAGIDLFVGGTQLEGYNIDITGFDVGFRQASTFASAMAIERLTLRGQRLRAAEVSHGSVAFEHLITEGTVPGLVVDGASAQATVVDSAMINTGRGDVPAVILGDGALFVRQVAVRGHSAGIVRDGRPVVRGSIRHFVSHPVTTAIPTEPQSLNLDREDAPRLAWGDTGTWVSVARHGAVGDGQADDTEALRRAFASGAATVYFPPGRYRVTGAIRMPSSLRRVNFMYSRIDVDPSMIKPYRTPPEQENSIFVICGQRSDPPLLIEDLFNRPLPSAPGVYRMFEHRSDRTVIMSDLHLQQGPVYKSTAQGGKVFFENVSSRTGGEDGSPAFMIGGRKRAWARWINPENGHPEIVVEDQASLRVLGLKKQAAGTLVRAGGGAAVEVLSAMVVTVPDPGPYPPDRVLLECTDASVSVSLSTRAPAQNSQRWDVMITESQRGRTGQVLFDDLPIRGDGELGKHQRFVPLYVGRSR